MIASGAHLATGGKLSIVSPKFDFDRSFLECYYNSSILQSYRSTARNIYDFLMHDKCHFKSDSTLFLQKIFSNENLGSGRTKIFSPDRFEFSEQSEVEAPATFAFGYGALPSGAANALYCITDMPIEKFDLSLIHKCFLSLN
jgi:hypothetical protein